MADVVDLTCDSDSDDDVHRVQPARKRRRASQSGAPVVTHVELPGDDGSDGDAGTQPGRSRAAAGGAATSAAAAAGGGPSAAAPVPVHAVANDAGPSTAAPAAAAGAENSDDDVEVVGEKGQVATRDLPHPRPDCAVHKFRTLPVGGLAGDVANAAHCSQCYCYVCDVKASECRFWGTGASVRDHANARSCTEWTRLRVAARSGQWSLLEAEHSRGPGQPPLSPQLPPRRPPTVVPSALQRRHSTPPMLTQRIGRSTTHLPPAAATIGAGAAAGANWPAMQPLSAAAGAGAGGVGAGANWPAGAHWRPNCPNFMFAPGQNSRTNWYKCRLCMCCRCGCPATECRSWGSGSSATDHANLPAPAVRSGDASDPGQPQRLQVGSAAAPQPQPALAASQQQQQQQPAAAAPPQQQAPTPPPPPLSSQQQQFQQDMQRLQQLQRQVDQQLQRLLQMHAQPPQPSQGQPPPLPQPQLQPGSGLWMQWTPGAAAAAAADPGAAAAAAAGASAAAAAAAPGPAPVPPHEEDDQDWTLFLADVKMLRFQRTNTRGAAAQQAARGSDAPAAVAGGGAADGGAGGPSDAADGDATAAAVAPPQEQEGPVRGKGPMTAAGRDMASCAAGSTGTSPAAQPAPPPGAGHVASGADVGSDGAGNTTTGKLRLKLRLPRAPSLPHDPPPPAEGASATPHAASAGQLAAEAPRAGGSAPTGAAQVGRDGHEGGKELYDSGGAAQGQAEGASAAEAAAMHVQPVPTEPLAREPPPAAAAVGDERPMGQPPRRIRLKLPRSLSAPAAGDAA